MISLFPPRDSYSKFKAQRSLVIKTEANVLTHIDMCKDSKRKSVVIAII